MKLFNIHTHKHTDNNSVFNVDISITDQIPETPFSIGVHPMNAHLWRPSLEERLLDLVEKSNCFAIGECGLDKTCEVEFSLQETVFINQIRIAQEFKKPLIIHCVKAYNELIHILKTEHFNQPVIIHGFRGKKELAQQLLREGYFISIGAGRQYLSDTIRIIPLDRLYVETDDRDEEIIDVYNDVLKIKIQMRDEI